jgi:hypothetical protein
LTALAEVLGEEENYDTVREVISDIIQSEKAKEREERKETKVISNLTKAAQNLADALDAWDDSTPKFGIEDQLSNISALLDKLHIKLKDPSDANA